MYLLYDFQSKYNLEREDIVWLSFAFVLYLRYLISDINLCLCAGKYCHYFLKGEIFTGMYLNTKLLYHIFYQNYGHCNNALRMTSLFVLDIIFMLCDLAMDMMLMTIYFPFSKQYCWIQPDL